MLINISLTFDVTSAGRYEIRPLSAEFGHVRDLGHAHIGVVLWSGRSRGPSSMSVPNLKRIALFVQKLYGGSQNFEIGSRDPKPRPF